MLVLQAPSGAIHQGVEFTGNVVCHREPESRRTGAGRPLATTTFHRKPGVSVHAVLSFDAFVGGVCTLE
jgi:hypothetical protein